jgi:hypothetical protein
MTRPQIRLRVPLALLFDPELKPDEKVLYGFIAAVPNNNPSYDQISAELRFSRRTIARDQEICGLPHYDILIPTAPRSVGQPSRRHEGARRHDRSAKRYVEHDRSLRAEGGMGRSLAIEGRARGEKYARSHGRRDGRLSRVVDGPNCRTWRACAGADRRRADFPRAQVVRRSRGDAQPSLVWPLEPRRRRSLPQALDAPRIARRHASGRWPWR